MADDVLDARDELRDVLRVDGRKHPHAQLVAPELAVRLGVDDAVGAQRRRDRRGVDALVEVDRADDERTLRLIGDERRGVIRGPGPAVEVARRRGRPLDAAVEARTMRVPRSPLSLAFEVVVHDAVGMKLFGLDVRFQGEVHHEHRVSQRGRSCSYMDG